MERIGDRLKKIRLEKGLSLEEVHKRTKVHINVLRAIEDDSFVNLNPVYVKGFLKIYCQFLGEDPAEYISDYRQPRQRVLVTGEQPAQVRQLRQPAASGQPAAGMPAGGPAVRRFTLPQIPLPSPRVLRALAAALVALVAVVLVVRLVSAGVRALKASNRKQPRPAASSVTKKPAVKPAAALPATSVPAAAAPAAAVPAAAPAAVKAPSSDTAVVRLGIRAKEDCWLQVRVDGKTVFQGVLNRGRLEGWQASGRIELTLGDAGKVDVEVNGSRIPALGRKGQSVKNILITRDGLKVGK